MHANNVFVIIYRVFGACTALAIAGFCAYSIASAQSWFAPTAPVAVLERADDPVRHGFAILETARKTAAPPRVDSADGNVVLLLDEWTYTDKGKPSPYK